MDSTLLQINKATARPLQPLDHQWFIPRQVEKSERAIGGTHHGRRSTVRRLGEKKESARKSELYKTEMCISVSEGVNCKYGDQCQFAHNKDELKHVERHPRYKTQFCTSFQRDGYCKYNDRCTFIHKAEEARITTGESGLSSTIPRAERRVSAHLRALASTPERGAKISAVSQKTGPATVSMETKATRDRNYLAQDLKPYSYSGKDTDYSSNILSVSESVQNQSFLSSQDMWFHGGVYNESSSTATGSFIFPFDYFQHCVPMSPSNSIDSVNTDTDSGYSAGSTSMRPFATPETQEIIDQGSYLEWGLKLARYISTKENEFDLDSLCSL
ncbi:hypothetical protein BGW38_000045 [Lunasporangiospora selenospora]|uniref:C3H1-type domain-containing protein n=1 Tax=Lunasporangiospora selenospora TaxID=979761 RepID=A0A9P6FW86_9FUNG|nr:hypothetical protein BGW38_000045 [Lunasporangiospora selenospora]